MSLHKSRAMEKAKSLRAFAGNPENLVLWDYSKRELIEIALHLGALSTESYDHALNSTLARDRVQQEHAALNANGII